MNTSTTTRKPQHLAYKLGIMIGLLGLAVLLLPAYDKFHARGPMNSGHDTLKCESCHQDAPGSLRQQIQANLRYALRLRERLADFSHQDVSNENCLGCHDFHGNHIMKTKKTVEQIIPAEKIRTYFQGGASPYGDDRHHKAKKEVNHD